MESLYHEKQCRQYCLVHSLNSLLQKKEFTPFQMESLYHEKQCRQYCLVHSLNSLLQRKEFTPETLDSICYQLTDIRWFNPHRSIIGTGNYDVNVLMAALDMHHLNHIWFDGRKSVDEIVFEKVHAFIFNVPSKSIVPFWKGRHWFTVLQKDQTFYNLDSKLDGPRRVDDILEMTREILEKENNQLIIVARGNTEELMRK